MERPWMRPFEMETGDKSTMIMPSRGLKLIGVRLYPYDGTCMGDERKAKCIQKSLYGRTEWFYFNKGFKIIESPNGGIEKITVEDNAFDSNEYLYSRADKWLNISVSAIVGQNGTGKSTIVDTVIRLVNNLSAAIIGEEYVYSSAQHLHYIDNVYASLAVYHNNKVLVLTCKGRKLTLTTYSADMDDLDRLYSETNAHVRETYNIEETNEVLKGNEPVDKILPPQENKRHLLEDWFYTLVSNYSLYAYNYRDYEYEVTNEAKLEYFQRLNPEMMEEDCYWLKGVFHKNDGYQTPVVIHPMREDGYINAAKVNMLGKQNLISLAFEQRDFAFPFRVINQTHHIVGFFIYRNKYDTKKSFVEQWIRRRFVVSDEQASKLANLERPIKDFWREVLGPDYRPVYKDHTYCKAWDYLAYKTIKVIWTYKHYKTVWDNMMHHYDEAQFKKDLKDLLRDSSHRTLKIRQTLAYLKYREEKGYYLNSVNVDVDSAWEWISGKIGQNLYHGNDYHKLEKEDLLPPPFLEVVLRLVDNEHYEAYKEGKAEDDIIPFGGLSSGERQIAYTIGNILYHLKNLESGKQDLNANRDHATAIKYDYVNIMLDEVELYFHPDLQRRFLGLLVDSIGGLKMDSCLGVNITLITHSPFVLSDIPSSNILYLSRDKDDKLRHSTFAANIHDLFDDAFFLPNTMGTIAQRKVEELVGYYNDVRLLKEKKNGWRPLDNRTLEQQDEAVAKMQYVASIVGDSYLHDELTDMVEEMLEWGKVVKRSSHEEN